MSKYKSPSIIDNRDLNDSGQVEPQVVTAFILAVGVTVVAAAFVANVGIGWNSVVGPDNKSTNM